jgi:hypothetical protein
MIILEFFTQLFTPLIPILHNAVSELRKPYALLKYYLVPPSFYFVLLGFGLVKLGFPFKTMTYLFILGFESLVSA